MDARGRRAGSRGPTEGTPGRRAASTSAPRVAPPPPAGLGRRSAAGRRAGTAERRRAGDPPGPKVAHLANHSQTPPDIAATLEPLPRNLPSVSANTTPLGTSEKWSHRICPLMTVH
ncbi:Transmembrane channel-like protein 2 [Manis javanica]|nr:Transmembrane channel-like protein 2 [Manis javanica]